MDCRDGVGWTPLIWASDSGHVDMVRMLISEFQADTTLLDKLGYTPLHMAVYWGRGEVALTLITEFGCDTNLPNNDGYTSLHTACANGDTSVVRIIGKYASPLATTKDGDTPLHVAAAREHKECVEVLLELDAPIMLKNLVGKTALHFACEKGLESIVKRVDKKEYLIATTKNGDTPLHIAAARRHKECVEALVLLYS